jgi:hypothetical protein
MPKMKRTSLPNQAHCFKRTGGEKHRMQGRGEVKKEEEEQGSGDLGSGDGKPA